MSTSSPELTTKTALQARVGNKLHAMVEAVQAKAKEVKQHLQKGSEMVQDKAGDATLQARSAANEALVKFPPPVSGRAKQLAATVRQRPVPAASVMLGVAVLLVLRLVLRRNS